MIPALLILALVIALIAIAFALQNSGVVVVYFLGWQFEGSLSFVLLSTLTIGVAIGLLVLMPALLKRSWQVAGHARRLQDLETQVEGQNRTLSTQHQKLDILRMTHQEVLGAFTLTEPHTGLLQARDVTPVLTYVLNQMQTAAAERRYTSVSLYILEPDGLYPSDLGEPAAALMAIANMLQAHVSPKSWLHSDGGQRFYCIALGLSSEAATEYGEFLCQLLQEHPVWLEQGEPTPIKLAVGGAISHQADSMNGQSLQEKAEEAFAKASRRGQHRFQMVEVTT